MHQETTQPPDTEDDEASPALTVCKKGTVTVDSGWAWLVALGCFVTHVLTDGMFYSFGVVFVELLDYFQGTKGETAWIASLAPGVLLLVGPLVGILTNRFGCRLVTIAGAILSSCSFILSSFAPNLYFLYFSLGVLTGIGYGMIYLPSIVCVSHCFEKRRALATGLGVCGSGVGTFIFSPFTKWLIDTYTWRGALLIQGGIVLNCAACGLLFRPPGPIGQPYSVDIKTSSTLEVDVVDSKETDSDVCFIKGADKTSNKSKNALSPTADINPSEPIFHDTTDNAIQAHQRSPLRNQHRANKMNQSEPDLRTELLPTVLSSKSVSTATFVAADGITKASVVVSTADIYTQTETPVDDQGRRERWTRVKNALGLNILSDKVFLLFAVSSFLYSLGYYVPYIYLPDRARDAGVDDVSAAWLVSSMGITNTAGRVIFGFLSDRKDINRLYLYNTALIICGISTALGPFFSNFGLLLLYTVLFGAFSGVTISLTSVILVDLMGIERLTDAFGMSNLFCGMAAFLGSPIAGWLYDGTGSYEASFVLAGVTIAFSGAILFFMPCVRRL